MKKLRLYHFGLLCVGFWNSLSSNLRSTKNNSKQSKNNNDASAPVTATGIDAIPLLTEHVYDPTSTNVTRIVWQTWKTRNLPFGERGAGIHREMVQRNKNWEFRVLIDEEMDDFMRKHFDNTIIYKAYLSLIPAAARADYWRYCVLYLYGGIYLDVDANIQGVLEEDFTEATVSLEYHGWKYIRDNCIGVYRDELKYNYPSRRGPNVTSPAIQWMLVHPRPYNPVLRHVILVGAALILKWRRVMTDQTEMERYLSQHRVYCLTGPALYTIGVVLHWNKDAPYKLIDHAFGGKAVAKVSHELAKRLRQVSNYKNQAIPLVKRGANATSSSLFLTSEDEALVDLILKPRTIFDNQESI